MADVGYGQVVEFVDELTECKGEARPPEEWLLSEWPEGEAVPTDCRLFALPPGTSLQDFVRLVKIRLHIKQDCQQPKEGLRLDPFEGGE